MTSSPSSGPEAPFRRGRATPRCACGPTEASFFLGGCAGLERVAPEIARLRVPAKRLGPSVFQDRPQPLACVYVADRPPRRRKRPTLQPIRAYVGGDRALALFLRAAVRRGVGLAGRTPGSVPRPGGAGSSPAVILSIGIRTPGAGGPGHPGRCGRAGRASRRAVRAYDV
jgi:hypothetical protein